MINKHKRYVAFDVETTGLYPHKGDRVIEIGGIVVENGCTMDEFSTLIDIEKPIPMSAQKIHGITDEMILNKPKSDKAVSMFYRFIRDSPLIAHNATFDCRFLRYELARLGLALENRYICTLTLSRRLLTGLPNHRLGTVYRHLFGRLPEETNLHRALDDARLAAEIWLKLNREKV